MLLQETRLLIDIEMTDRYGAGGLEVWLKHTDGLVSAHVPLYKLPVLLRLPPLPLVWLESCMHDTIAIHTMATTLLQHSPLHRSVPRSSSSSSSSANG